MTHVLLLGVGDLPDGSLKQVDFPHLRTWQFLRGILNSGHTVTLIVSHSAGNSRWRDLKFEGHQLRRMAVTPHEYDSADLPARWVDQVRPDAVVSAGPFAPARAAARIPRGVPVWIDLPGDLMAEAQLRSACTGDAIHLEHAYRVLGMALHRGDAFSTASERQRFAVLGQLGCVGRLTNEVVGWDGVHVIPVAVEPAWIRWAEQTETRRRSLGRVIWPGSINTWADAETFFEACEIAMARCAFMTVVVTGGPIAGHEESSYHRFKKRVEHSRTPSRWRLTGWIDAVSSAREVREAQVGVSLDRLCVEAVLGSRTRLMYGLALGLPWITTSGCELADKLVACGLARGVKHEDVEGLAEALVDAVNGCRDEHTSLDRYNHFLGEYTSIHTTRALAKWLDLPAMQPTSHCLEQTLQRRINELECALADVYHSPTWRILNRGHRIARTIRRSLSGRERVERQGKQI